MTTAAPPVQDAEGPGVTTLELFFDLVFVFTMTQLTRKQKRNRPVLVSEPG